MRDSNFIEWYHNTFTSDPLYTKMEATSENSKWHRERNVAVHTDMVVAEYISRTSGPWNQNDLLGAFACAFHDTGKPKARTEKFSEERGTYYSYGGHEIMSARIWEDWAAANWAMLSERFEMIPTDLYAITWMIEHHRPWGLKKPEKRLKLYETATHTVGVGVFTRLLFADNYGRIGDTQDANRLEVHRWVDEFVHTELEPFVPDGDKPTVHVLIGPSGAGKSTYTSTLDDVETYSWDELRLRWYNPDDYDDAFLQSTKDNQFMSKVNAEYMRLIKSGANVAVDNTNISAKRRRFFIDEARKNGYRVVGVTFPTAVQTVLDRQSTRGDKVVPAGAVAGQFFGVQQPQFGEFDQIVVCGGNLT